MDSAIRSLMEPPGFWFSSLRKSRHGPVSNCVTSTSGVSPMSDRIAGGLLCAIDGDGEVSVMRGLLDRRFSLVRPFRLAVFEKLLEHRETDFAVIQCVTEIAAFVNPSRRDPRQRQTCELFDFA